ncbi:uncharacterized protein UDID_18805 [Ustilago sp. UG-2017a]|nr:uncharacterized protein UDID_18805 [Ustilago sp. UG-2017a]
MLWPLARPSLDLLWWSSSMTQALQGKYGARAKPAIMIGYDDEHKAWKFCNPDQPASIQWSNSATFHEDKGWSDRQQETCKPMEVEEETEFTEIGNSTDSMTDLIEIGRKDDSTTSPVSGVLRLKPRSVCRDTR